MKAARYSTVIFFILLAVLLAWSLATLPIFAGDTDVWFDISGGQYLFQHHAIPRTSYFSFIDPPRRWTDYYWLFQALVYCVYNFFQYSGLIVLRMITFLATVFMIWRYISKVQHADSSFLWRIVLGTLYGLVLIPRYASVRPHAIVYLLLVTFLYILELEPRGVIVLPLLSVLWVNLHGVSYPLILLICGAYLLGDPTEQFLPGRTTPSLPQPWLILLLAMAGTLLTPQPWQWIRVPFTSLETMVAHVAELRPFEWTSLFQFHISHMALSHETLVAILVWLTWLCLARALFTRRWTLRHLLLWAGGLLLLVKSGRFISEYALLSLPIVVGNPLPIPRIRWRPVMRALAVLSASMLLGLTLRFVDGWRYSLGDPRPYPVSYRNLPEAVATFLHHINVGGRILNDPNTGGYLRWRVFPRYQIFMDLELHSPFSDEDLSMANDVFFLSSALKRFLATYDPSFITVPFKYADFPKRIQEVPDFVPIFFDDAQVLYLNKRHYPSLAAQYELAGIDPFSLAYNPQDAIAQADLHVLQTVLERMLSIDTNSELINYLMGLTQMRAGVYQQALRYARAAIACNPGSPRSYWLMGDALTFLGARAEALVVYQEGIRQYARKRRFDFGKAEPSELLAVSWLENKEIGRVQQLVRGEQLRSSNR